MDIWLQKPMTNTSLMNMETLTPKGAPGGISKLVIYGSKELHGHSLLLKQKLGVSRTFGSHTLWKCLSSPTELAQYISDQESLVPPHPLCDADHASEFPCALCKDLSVSLKSAFKTEVSLAQLAFYHLSEHFYFHPNISFLLRY